MINKAVESLENHEVIICPSESCYSLSCDAKSQKAVEKLHELKGESKDKPITILVANLTQLEDFAIVTKDIKKIVDKLMPGQLNLIVEKKDKNKYNFIANDSICFRIPNNQIMLEICKKFGAITTTSANLHGQPSLYKIEDVKKTFENKVNCILDAGDLNENIPVSTIYDTRTGKILREGLVTEEEIKEI